MTPDPVDCNVHAQVFAALPIHFNLIKLGKCIDEVVDARLVLPYDSEVIDYERESDRSATIAEYGRGTGDLRISMLV